MRVDIESIHAIEVELAKINEVPFSEIEWYEGGAKLDIPADTLDDWRFIGMTNACFITTGFYETEGWVEVPQEANHS